VNLASPAAPPLNSARPWLADYNEAWRVAAQQGKPMLIVLHRQSCLPCKELLYSTCRDGRVRQRLLDRYVLTVLDVDRAEPRVVQGLSEGRLVLPMMVVVERGRIVARRTGHLLPAACIQWLDQREAPNAIAAAVPTSLPIVRPAAKAVRLAGCAACGAAAIGNLYRSSSAIVKS
jgi:hypothetical protein